MSDDRRKLYSKKTGTGTVPKIKYAKNTINGQEQDPNLLSNNLGRDSYTLNRPRYFPSSNSERSQRSASFHIMDHSDEANQNSLHQSMTTINSKGDSRRNSSETITKCDNITKYPDKKQIEDKLNQIRECLSITSSIVSNMKNSDEQSYDQIEKEEIEKTYNNLKDSEGKLCNMLADIEKFENGDSNDQNERLKTIENGIDNVQEQIMRLPKNQLEKKVEQTNHQLELLMEQENLLLTLQQKAENQLREARRAQQKLMSHQQSNHYADDSDVNTNDNVQQKSASNSNIRDLEERWNAFRLELNSNPSDNLDTRDGDDRTQLIQMLDKRDVQLQNEHAELQSKLWELQNKKRQVDQLVSQLQNMNQNDESEEDDMAGQVRKIVVMKEQLTKLKDMLEIVKNTEYNAESDGEMNDSKSHNLIQNDVSVSNECERKVKDKQVNKKTMMNAQERERLKLQRELQAKKRELEELMCKHKEAASTSNLNQDVRQHDRCEYKPDGMAAINNNTFEAAAAFYRMYPGTVAAPKIDPVYSSDEAEGPDEDDDEYSEVNSSGDASNAAHVAAMVPPMVPIEVVTTIDDYLKNQQQQQRQAAARQFLFCPTTGADQRSETRTSSRTPDRPPSGARTGSGIQPISNTTGLPKQRMRTNSEREFQNKTQTQKQLELIRSVCDSMLEQQQQSLTKPTSTSSTAQNVRNNLTPSPLYSESEAGRQFQSPNPNSMNALNVVNNPSSSNSDGNLLWCFPNNQMMPGNNSLPNGSFMVSNDANPSYPYQNWIATNTLQTQAYMLNTLNQCCQMLWLQQKEIASLRNNVMMMQEKLQIPFDQSSNPLPPPPPPLYANAPPQPQMAPKLNHNHHQQHQVSSATSLPNLNQSHHPHATATNLEPYSAAQNNNLLLHNARILESGGLLNNNNNTLNVHHQQQQQPTLPSQIWNGPAALNNQVAPGNRANNYWDNFRSYSRQNLLSTKSNEGLQINAAQHQSSSNDRLNNSIDSSSFVYHPPFSTATQPQTQKARNTIFQEVPLASTTTQSTPRSSNETTPRRRLAYKSSISDRQTTNDTSASVTSTNFIPEAVHSNLADEQLRSARENQQPTSTQPNQTKSKLFEEMRENVYKEVASLISANQGRPHFLLQLFRDLQLISSDPLRRQTLQSIQSLVSNSLVTSNSATDSLRQQSQDDGEESLDNDGLDNAQVQPSYFMLPPFNNQTPPENNLDTDCPTYLSDVLTFLNLHSEEVLQQSLLDYLKELLVESTFPSVFTNSNNPKDGIVHKHFACLVSSAFEQFKGKKVQQVRLDILQTIEELLRGEISLIRLMRDSISETNEVGDQQQQSQQQQQQQPQQPPIGQSFFNLQSDLIAGLAMNVTSSIISEATHNQQQQQQQQQQQVQNGDLAEADQSRMDIEEEEEEGAIGGILCVLNESANEPNQAEEEELDTTNLDFTNAVEGQLVELGLDQVPTRLSAHSRSKMNISRDRSNSSRSDTEQI